MRRAWSLLETVVTLVVLGVLAVAAIFATDLIAERSAEQAGQSEVRALLTEAQALAAFEERDPQRGDVAAAVLDSPSHQLLAPGAASRHERWLSTGEDDDGVAVAMYHRERCILARLTREGIETWSRGNLGGNCTGSVALLGPEHEPAYTPPLQVALSPPAGVSAHSFHAGELTVTWEEVPGAAQYLVRSGTTEKLVLERTARLDGLPEGVETTIEVLALDETGAEGPSSGAAGTPRRGGVWDALLQWRYDGNTICHGGTSSWTWQMTASTYERNPSGYRAEILYENETLPGASPWGGERLQPYRDGYLSTPEVQVCAPGSGRPFSAARVVDGLRNVVTFESTGLRVLTEAQIRELDEGAALTDDVPGRP